MILETFSDLNAPGLKGKLKIFVLGLCLGHPVHSKVQVEALVRNDEKQPVTLRNTTCNVLKGFSSGGKARVYSCTGIHR